MKMLKWLTCIFLLPLVYCCSSDDSPSGSQNKQYDVEYQITSSRTVSEVSYRTKNGDTLYTQDVPSGWKYKWSSKGNSGDSTYIKVTLIKTTTNAHFRIIANEAILDSGSVEGASYGTSSASSMITLPY